MLVEVFRCFLWAYLGPRFCDSFPFERKHRISGLVVEYIVAIDVTRARFPADAYVLKMSLGSSARHAGQRDAPRSCVGAGLGLCADGSIAQWLERLTADQQVPGSNPGWPFV